MYGFRPTFIFIERIRKPAFAYALRAAAPRPEQPFTVYRGGTPAARAFAPIRVTFWPVLAAARSHAREPCACGRQNGSCNAKERTRASSCAVRCSASSIHFGARTPAPEWEKNVPVGPASYAADRTRKMHTPISTKSDNQPWHLPLCGAHIVQVCCMTLPTSGSRSGAMQAIHMELHHVRSSREGELLDNNLDWASLPDYGSGWRKACCRLVQLHLKPVAF